MEYFIKLVFLRLYQLRGDIRASDLTDEEAVEQLGYLNCHEGNGNAMEIIDSIEREERVDNMRHEHRLKNIGDGHVLGHGVNEVDADIVAMDEEGRGVVGVMGDTEAIGEGREEIEGGRERQRA